MSRTLNSHQTARYTPPLEQASVADGLLQNAKHVVEVVLFPGERHPDVQGARNHRLGLGQRFQSRRELPVLEEARVGRVAEELHR